MSVALVGLALLAVLALAAAAAPVSARTGELQGVRAKAKALATNVAALDAQIDAAVQRCTRATDSLVAVRREISGNKRLQTLALRELDVARATLVARAVALYKHDDVTALDAMFSADDFGDLVSRLTMVQSIAHGDRDVLRTVERTKRELADRAVSLVADERTARKLVVQRDAELKTVKAQLGERQALLAGVRREIRHLAAKRGVPAEAVGTVGERGGAVRIGINGWAVERPIARLAEIYERAIPRRMERAAGA